MKIKHILTSFFIFFTLNTGYSSKENTISFTKNGIIITLEIAKTEKERERGLMFRTSMPKNHGMIFIFNQPQPLSFWMKNTFIPLDMIFLNHQKIVAIFYDVPPCPKETLHCPSYSSIVDADTVIELNAGMTNQLKLAKRDKIVI